MRKLLVTLLVLLGLLLLADRAGAALAGTAVAREVQRAGALPATPDVDVRGFPFLTQALAGRYDRVEVAARDVPAGELELSRLDATLTGVQVPLSDAVSGAVASVPVEGVAAQVLLPYDELAQRSGERQLTLAPDGDRVRVTGSVELLGQTLSAVAVSRVELVDGAVVVTAEEVEVGNEAADDLLTRALGDRFDLRVPVTALPYDLEVTDVEVRPEGIVVRAAAQDVLLG